MCSAIRDSILACLIVFFFTGTVFADESISLQNLATPLATKGPPVGRLITKKIKPTQSPDETQEAITIINSQMLEKSVSQHSQPVAYATATPDRAVEQVPVGLPLAQYDCIATVNRPYWYEKMSFGQEFEFDVTLTNSGLQEWNTSVDVVQYTGMRLEIEGQYLYDLDKDYDLAYIVYPGQSIRIRIRMKAPEEKTREDDKYFATYSLIQNRNMEEVRNGEYDFNSGMFCPFSYYIFVPPPAL